MEHRKETGLAVLFRSEGIHLRLGSNLSVILRVVITFDIKIIHQSDRQEVEVPDGNAKLYAAQQKERRCHLPLCSWPFFLLTDCVCRFSPHSSMISGSTW